MNKLLYGIKTICQLYQIFTKDFKWSNTIFSFSLNRTIDDLEFGKALGFILNIPSKLIGSWPSAMLNRRHWLALRKVEDCGYYNLDSKLKQPQLIGDEEALKEFLEKHLKTPDVELLTVIEEKTPEPAE